MQILTEDLFMTLKNARIWLSLLLLGLLFTAPSSAVERPIKQSMPVEDRGSAERVKASISGFSKVLKELPGEQLGAQERRALAREADNYLQGYRYATRNGQLYLQLYFDRDGVKERVKQELKTSASVEAESAYPQERLTSQPKSAPVLLWLAVTQGDFEAVLTNTAEGALPERLSKVSQQRGLPILLPLESLKARDGVQVVQLRGGEVEPVLRASATYGIERVLMGSLEWVEGEEWSAVWQVPGSGRRWRSENATLEAVLDEGLLGYRQLTLAEASPSTGRSYGMGADEISVRVNGIKGMDDFRWVNAYFAKLLGADRARAVAVGSDTILFAVKASEGAASIEGRLEGEKRLAVLPPQFSQSAGAQSADILYMLY